MQNVRFINMIYFQKIVIIVILPMQNVRFLNLISTSLLYYSFCPGRMSDSKMNFASDWHNWHSNQGECQIPQSDFHQIVVLHILTIQNVKFLNLISTTLVYYTVLPLTQIQLYQ